MWQSLQTVDVIGICVKAAPLNAVLLSMVTLVKVWPLWQVEHSPDVCVWLMAVGAFRTHKDAAVPGVPVGTV